MKFASRYKLALSFLLFSIIVPTFIVSSAAAESTQPDLINDNRLSINPFRAAFKSLNFYDAEDDKPLGSLSTQQIYSEGESLWTPVDVDSDHLARNYPKIQTYLSEPFLVNNQGLNIYGSGGENDTMYVVDPSCMVNTMEKDPETGLYIYIAKVNIGFDYLIKTVSNLKPITYNFYPITQLNNIAASHTKPTAIPPFVVVVHGYDIFSKGRGYTGDWGDNGQNNPPNSGWEPATGVLAAGWDYGNLVYSKAEPTTWYVGGGSNKVGIGISLNNWKDVTGSQKDVANNYGNRGVKVVANIQASSFANPVLYNYFKEVNGNVFEVSTESTEMGFYDAKLIPSLDDVGKVPEFISPSEYFQITNEGIKTDGISATAEKDPFDSSNNIGDTTVPGMETTSIRAYYRCTETYTCPASTGGPVPTYILGRQSGIPVTSVVSTESFDSVLPKTLSVTMTDRLKPYSTQSRAVYSGSAVGFEHYYLGTPGLADSTYHRRLWTDDFPYRINIENTYIVHRVVITCLVKTLNNILYVPASGEPVNVEDFKDYGINSLGVFNPDMNDAGGGADITYSDPMAIFSDIVVYIIIIIAVIGAVIIVVAISVNVARQRSGYQGGFFSTQTYNSNRKNFSNTFAALKNLFKKRKGN